MKPLATSLRWLLSVLLALLAPMLALAQTLPGTFAAGTYHSLAIHADGTLWATGDNSYGQLGTGTTATATAWVQVGTATNWVQVAVGEGHSLGLRADGTLYAWGQNAYGQLGNGVFVSSPSTPTPTPRQVAGTYTQVAAGAAHSLGLRADGTLWAWGGNYNGQLGNPTFSGSGTATATPTQVAGTYVQVAAGGTHSLGLRADGTLYAWGSNYYGQLGNTINTGRSNAANPTPTPVAGIYIQMAAGAGHSLGLRADGTLWAWGWNLGGQLGNPTNTGGNAANPMPTQVAGIYTQIAAGTLHSLGLRANGALYAWGSNQSGQLGTSTNSGSGTANATPTQVAGTYVQAVGGGAHSLGLRADGGLWAWGNNSAGQLGNAINFGNSNGTSINPTPAVTGTALPTRSLAMGSNFGLAVRGDGTLWAWGDNQYGQLGLSTTTARTTRPVQVGTATDWVMVAAGQYHSLGLRADGTLYAWGYNLYGQLGTTTNSGTGTANPTPTMVPGTYTQVAAGQYHSLGLRADGTLYAWGYNLYGQLGTTTNNGSTASANPVPTVVPGTYTQVAAGGSHSLGLRADGSLYAWGYNYYGQLGNATNNVIATANPTPTQVAGTYTQVAAGEYHSLGLRADGSLYGWGNNIYGQLGNPANNSSSTPNPVPTVVPGIYTQVAAGDSHSLGLRADGSLYAWGYNGNGQLGNGPVRNGTLTPYPYPTQEVTLNTGWTTLGTGSAAFHSLARTASAQSFASTGFNSAGQLGDGTTTNATRFDRVSPLTSLQPLPVRPAAPAGAGLSLYPNPTKAGATLLGAMPGQRVQVLDALGRLVLTTAADASGTTLLTLPVELQGGVYVVRTGTQALRLLVK